MLQCVNSPVTTYLRAGLPAASTLIVIMKSTLVLLQCLDIVLGEVMSWCFCWGTSYWVMTIE